MRTSLTLTALLLLALPVFAQRSMDRGGPPGGAPSSGGDPRGGSMRGGPNPDDSFNQLVQSYGGTGDTLDYSKVSADRRERFNRFASFSGAAPMPTSGSITRDQYKGEFNKRMEAMQAKMGGNRGGPPNAAPTAPGVTVTLSTAPPGAAAPAPNMPPAEAPVSEEDVQRFLRRYDKDNDGRVSFAEAKDSDRLNPVFAAYDRNTDGFMDSAEFRTYVQDRFNNRNPDGSSTNGKNNPPPPQMNYDPRGGYGGGYDPNQGRRDTQPPAEEEKPVVYRYGKLPTKELPSWFERLDTDKDGQVGLYEWRADKDRAMAEWIVMDLNSDGYLTAEEYLRFKKIKDTPDGSLSAVTSTSSESKDTKSRGKDDRNSGKDDKKSKGNPFRDK